MDSKLWNNLPALLKVYLNLNPS